MVWPNRISLSVMPGAFLLCARAGRIESAAAPPSRARRVVRTIGPPLCRRMACFIACGRTLVEPERHRQAPGLGRKSMRGVSFLGDRELQLLDFPDPTPGPHDVVLEMKASGMCGSDLHQYRRPKGGTQATGLPMPTRPVIAGHEPCGVVAAIGSAVDPAQAKIGQRVMVHHYQGCTNCEHCRAGWQQLCQNVPVKVYGNNNDGGHAPYMLVPANTLVTLPDELTFAAGAAIACGTGTAYGALRRINLSGN